MMNFLQLREYDACMLWLESLKSKSTLNAYTTHLSLFCRSHNTDPDGLIHNSADKDKETQIMQQKYEQDMKTIREEMENKFQQILAKIDTARLC